jgi:glycosyltransferase involved in cell wall biosynthesis
MKICHFTTVHPRDDGRIFFKQCVFLAKTGHNVTFVVADGIGNDFQHGVTILDIGKFEGNRILRTRRRTRKMLCQLQHIDADIFQFHDPELIQVGIQLKSSGKKVIYDSHEDVPRQILYKTWLGPLWIRKIIARIYNRYEKRKVGQLDGLISVIEEITEQFKCPHRVTVKNFPITSHLIQARQQDSERLPQIIYVGSITRPRGIVECIEAMRFVPEPYRLVLIGRFIPEQLLASCQQLPEWERVDYIGFKTLEELSTLLGSSKIGLSVLHAEQNYLQSLPTKGFEYMAAGLPIVMSNFPYWRPYFEGCAEMIEPGDPEVIGTAIQRLIQDQSHYHQLKSCAEERSLTYSWEGQFTLLESFYMKILQNEP